MRVPALVAVAVTALVAVVLGLRYSGEADPSWSDKKARMLARDWFVVPREPARLLIGLFDPLPLALLIAALVATCLVLRLRRLAVVAVAGPVLTGVATTLLKPVVDRTKNDDIVYPSGHMGAAVALALVVALMVVSVVGLSRTAALAVMVVVPAVVGTAIGLVMTITNYHYMTDAVGGFCVAVSVVLSVGLLLDRWPRVRRGTPTHETDVETPGFPRAMH